MEELLGRIRQEINRLQEKEIRPAETNANNLNDIRIRKMADRFVAYKKVLEKAINEESLTTITEFANDIYRNINWTSSEIEDVDNRIDSFKILVWILNLITSREQKINYLEKEPSLDNAEKIINILDTREK